MLYKNLHIKMLLNKIEKNKIISGQITALFISNLKKT